MRRLAEKIIFEMVEAGAPLPKIRMYDLLKFSDGFIDWYLQIWEGEE